MGDAFRLSGIWPYCMRFYPNLQSIGVMSAFFGKLANQSMSHKFVKARDSFVQQKCSNINTLSGRTLTCISNCNVMSLFIVALTYILPEGDIVRTNSSTQCNRKSVILILEHVSTEVWMKYLAWCFRCITHAIHIPVIHV